MSLNELLNNAYTVMVFGSISAAFVYHTGLMYLTLKETWQKTAEEHSRVSYEEFPFHPEVTPLQARRYLSVLT